MSEKMKLPLILNQTNALMSRTIENIQKNVLSTSWHKFIIHEGAQLDSKQILKSIVKYGGDIFPIQHEIVGANTTFIARNCTKAIENLCAKNLVLKYSAGKEPVYLSIHVNEGIPSKTTLNIQDVITEVINKRFNQKTGVLDLEDFVNDPDLNNKLYCAINQSKVLMFVLSLSSGLDVKCLRLNNNEMTNVDGLEVMAWSSPSLYSIDLRNNLIANISELIFLRHLNITELWLDENPICNAYEDYNYVLSVQEVCPKIEKLDGEELFKNGIPKIRRNYLIKCSSLDLIDQFVEHYFTLYDANREALIDLYHSEALFSLTTSIIPNQITSTTKRLDEFERLNRNLLKSMDYPNYEKWLYHSREDIVKILCKLSPTKHDPHSFTIDVLYDSVETIVVLVSGVFRAGSDTLVYDSRNLLNFSRTFVLLATSEGEYHIVNEQLFVSNAATSQVKLAFQNGDEANGKTYTDEERSCLIETMVEICETDEDTAKRLLEITKWDLKSSLSMFVDESIEQVMMTSTNESAPFNSYPSSQFPNYTPNPPIGIPNSFFEIPNPPIGIPNQFFENTIPPPIDNTNQFVEIPNPPFRIPNQFVETPMLPQSSQITSTTNEPIPELPRRYSNIITIQPNPSIQTSKINKNGCDVCFYFGCHRIDCPNHPNNVVQKSTISNERDLQLVTKGKDSTEESNTSTSIAQMYSVINELKLRDGGSSERVLEARKTMQNTIIERINKGRKNRGRCRICSKRHPPSSSCNSTKLNSETSSTNINKDDRKKQLDKISTKVSTADCSKPQQKPETSTLNTGKATKNSSETIESTNTEKSSKPSSEENIETLQTTTIEQLKPSTSYQNTGNNDSTENQSETNSEVFETIPRGYCMRPICFYCGLKKHGLLFCLKRKQDIKNGCFNSVKAVESLKAIKNSCKKITKNHNGEKTILCQYCGGFGHSADTCQQLQKTMKCITNPLEERKILECNFCGKTGHKPSFCKQLVEELKKLPTPIPETIQITPAGKSLLVCMYCGNMGHKITFCYRLKRDMERTDPNSGTKNVIRKELEQVTTSKQGLVCTFCGNTGHSNNHCRQLQTSLLRTLLCVHCGQLGHAKETCPKIGYSLIELSRLHCSYCFMKGHEISDCIKRQNQPVIELTQTKNN